MSEVVTTLPLATREDAKFHRLVTPINLVNLGAALGSERVIFLGKYGLHPPTEKSLETTSEEYLNAFENVELSIARDDNNNYVEFVLARIHDLYSEGTIEKSVKSFLKCECGVTNINVEALAAGIKPKAIRQSDGDEVPKCAHCGDTELAQYTSDVLVTTPSLFAAKAIAKTTKPNYTQKKSSEFLQEKSNQRFVLTKPHESGGQYPSVEIESDVFLIDPDFWHAFVPLFLKDSYDSVSLVAGARMQSLAVMTASIWSKFEKVDDFRSMLHPRLRFSGEMAEELEELPIRDYPGSRYESMGRLIVTLANNWSTHEGVVNDQTVRTAQTTAENFHHRSHGETLSNIDEFLQLTKPDNARRVFKSIRSGKAMSQEDKVVANSVRV